MKNPAISFEVMKDDNAPTERRYILRVLRGDKCIEAPRFRFLDEATQEIGGYIEEFPNQKKFKTIINL